MRAMDRNKLALSCIGALALVGCQLSCDGERAKGAQAPKPPDPQASGQGSAGAALDPTGEGPKIEPTIGFLDAPAGTLDGLYAGLAAADRQDASGRVLVLFFGDSHTAGDSMTSRLRTTWQLRFGDAG